MTRATIIRFIKEVCELIVKREGATEAERKLARRILAEVERR